MGSSNRQSISAQVWGLVRAQHGVVARWQLLELGMSAPAIRHRLSTGRLHRIERGVYAVGRPTLTKRGRWMAAVLGGRSGAVLSHGSAAALWGFGAEVDGRIEISVPVDSGRRSPTVEVHRRPGLRHGDITRRDGIPVTGATRTLVDIAVRLGRVRLERAINEADRLELVDPEVLLAKLEEYSGQRGVARLREVLSRRTVRLTDSELERRFLRLINAAGLAMPETGVRLNGFKVDFFWPDLGLVVETDGLRYHRTPAQQARDRLRDQAHTAAGMTPLRFTHEQVSFQADYVQDTLNTVVRRLKTGTS